MPVWISLWLCSESAAAEIAEISMSSIMSLVPGAGQTGGPICRAETAGRENCARSQ